MPSGRPRKPIALKLLEGDTRQRGANVHAETLGKAFVVLPGPPPLPEVLAKLPLKPPADAEPERRYRMERERNILKTARQHWDYLMGVLAPNALLSTCDQGILLAHCMAFGEMSYADGQQRMRAVEAYGKLSNLSGLNASARAKFTAPPKAMDDLEAALCG